MSNWKKIWSKKGSGHRWVNDIKDVMAMNGFNDTGVTYESYLEFWKHVNKKFNIQESSSFYEVGCGAGLSLKILHEELGHIVGGSDYAKNSTITAKGWDISSDIECLEADDIPTNPKYDYLVAFSVFHYFPNLEYTAKVLKIMLEKSNKGIGIFDICDEEKKDIYVATRKEADSNYEEKYKGLDHLFINKNFWNRFASENDLSIYIEDQHIKHYKNSKLRYNIYLTK